MRIKNVNGVEFCIFENIESTGLVNHCFTTRKGGVSQGVFESLNVSYSRGDDKSNVDENMRRLSEAVGFDTNKIVSGHQIHKTEVLQADYSHCLKSISGYDGYITDKPGIVLCTFHADCVPLFFVDPVKKVIALSHSGWRGTAHKMAQVTVNKMKSLYGCKAENILAGIGPSIGKRCFQVDKPVVDEFNKNMDFAMEYILPDMESENHYKADLWQINKRLMIESGLKEENIEVTDKCTMCCDDLFFSHRRMGDKRGSMAAFMSLKEF